MKVIAIIALAALLGVAASAQQPTGQTGSVAGLITDSKTGEPIANVQVSLGPDGMTSNPFISSGQITATSDAAGRFTLSGISAGKHRINTTKSGYAPAKPSGRKVPGSQGLLFTIAPGQAVRNVVIPILKSSTMTGRLIDTAGAVVSGLRVTAHRLSYDEFGEEILVQANKASANDKGEFRIFDLDPGEYYLIAAGESAFSRSTGGQMHREVYYVSAWERSRAQLVAVQPGEELLLRDIIMPVINTVPVHIRVVNETGVPYPPLVETKAALKDIVNFNILMQIPGSGPPDSAPKNISARLFPGLNIVYTGAGFSGGNTFVFAQTMLNVAVGQEPNVELVLRKPFHVIGRAILLGSTGDPSPVSALTVNMALKNAPVTHAGSNSFLTFKTGTDGVFSFNASEAEYRFVFSGLPVDAYLVSAMRGAEDVLSGPVQISGDSHIEVIAASGGGLLDCSSADSSGKPISGAMVALVPEPSLRNRWDLYRSGTSDQTGKVEFRGIAPGRYKVFSWINAEGIAPYKNAQFLKQYEDDGKEIQIAAGRHVTALVRVADLER